MSAKESTEGSPGPSKVTIKPRHVADGMISLWTSRQDAGRPVDSPRSWPSEGSACSPCRSPLRLTGYSPLSLGVLPWASVAG
jgi:hypothetical protein